MKNLMTFERFILESEDINNGEDTEEDKKDKKDLEHLPKFKDVVDKEFFGELKDHIYYWFNYDKTLKNKYVLESLEADEDETSAWFYDVGDSPEFQYKAVYSSYDGEEQELKRTEEVNLMLSIYEHETQTLLKQTDMKITLKYVSAESFNNFLEDLKKKIIHVPQNDADVQDFKKKERRRLSDYTA